MLPPSQSRRSGDGDQVQQSSPSIVSPDVEQPPTAMPEVDAAPVRPRIGVESFVASAYEAHHAEIFGFLARATRDRSVAEDLLQEAFRRLAREAGDRRDPGEVRAWLFRVASGLVIERTRREATRLGRPHANGHEQGAADLDQALDGLTADARVALLLSAAGFRGDGIAVAMGRTEAATRTLLSRARARVRVRRDLYGDVAQ